MDRIIESILGWEWVFFRETENIGGRAACQDDPETFFRMRRSQWRVYDREVLESYREDLYQEAFQAEIPWRKSMGI